MNHVPHSKNHEVKVDKVITTLFPSHRALPPVLHADGDSERLIGVFEKSCEEQVGVKRAIKGIRVINHLGVSHLKRSQFDASCGRRERKGGQG